MYKDKIYDITALDMTRRLEFFLNNSKEGGYDEITTLGNKIKYFTKHPPNYHKGMPDLLWDIVDIRNKIVHPDDLKPVLDLGNFRQFQKKCFELENMLRKNYNEVRITEVLPTLKYDMGNAGDIIKHGLLAEFVKWWSGEPGGKTLRVADTFAGCPWDNIYNEEIRMRLNKLRDEGSMCGLAQKKTGKYIGSSFLIRQVAEECGVDVKIDISDKDDNARCNWENAILGKEDSMSLIELPEGNDGYTILNDKQNPDEYYDLILIDPYGEFLLEQYRKENTIFHKIKRLIDKHENLYVALYVLDMKDNPIRDNFDNFKETIQNCFMSLRCPKITGTSIRGESSYDSEIMLIGKQIAKKESGRLVVDNCKKLREQLEKFADIATEILPLKYGEKVKFWNGEQL